MPSILCRRGGTEHHHDSVLESKICWGVISRSSAPASGYVSHPVSPPRVDPATPKQIAYVGTLGGDEAHARTLDKTRCSAYIKELLAKKGAEPVSTPVKQTRTKRQDFIIGLLPSIPDGYFAVSPDGTDSNVIFLRKKCPTSGKLKGCTKIQSQHGEQLEDELIYYPGSDRLWLKNYFDDKVEEAVMFLFADYKGAAMRYARLIGKCCRCNKPLTDKRSRWYGIGPDCEGEWPWMLEDVEAIKGPYREGY
jgi:hypothetical protein